MMAKFWGGEEFRGVEFSASEIRRIVTYAL